MAFHGVVTDEHCKQLVGQMKPWGEHVFVYHRRDNMRHLETRSQKGFYMGPRSGRSMDRVFLKKGGTGAFKQFRHVLVPPAFAQQHAMRMHWQLSNTRRRCMRKALMRGSTWAMCLMLPCVM